MKTTYLAALVCTLVLTNAHAQNLSSEKLQRPTIERPAVEAAVWGMPTVSFDSMRQAFFRDGHAKYNDVIFWSNQPPTWKLQCLTANTSVRYVFSFINTRESGGPVVVEIPATGDAAVMGTLIDAWQVPLTDVGLAGEDKGKGAKYLLLPPGHQGDAPAGYVPVPMQTHNGMVGLRVIAKSADDANKAVAYLKQIRVYPLSQAAAPPQAKYVDMADTVWDAHPRYDASFYTSLARMVNEEPARPSDAKMIDTLGTLGIKKGTEFKPSEATQTQLNAAAQQTHTWLLEKLVTFGSHYWPDRHWDTLMPPVGPKTHFTWEADGVLDANARGIAFSSFFCPPKDLGAGQSYLAAYNDADGKRLSGAQTYRLHVPGDVPVKEFWSVTVYDLATCALIRDVDRASLDSYNKTAKRNADGSMDVYFGPKARAGMESNWIPTVAGKDWFPYFRLYGPEEPFAARTWKLPDIEKVN